MRHSLALVGATLFLAGCADEEILSLRGHSAGIGWSQWGQDARHQGRVDAVGQAPNALLAELTLDPFIYQEIAEASGDSEERSLLVHFQAPLVVDDDVFVETKAGTFVACDPPGSAKPAPCGVDAWDHQEWREERWTWQGGELSHVWTFASDWKPPPNGFPVHGWEPVFHAAIAGANVLLPAAGGGVWAVDRASGAIIARIDPFAGAAPDRTFVVGPLTVGKNGDVYYHAVRLAPLPPKTGAEGEPQTPWDLDVEGAWLVHVAPDGTTNMASFADLVPDAPAAKGPCPGGFTASQLPWPPAPDAKPSAVLCGSQRPGINVAPAVADDGTIFTVSRAHYAGRASFVVAVTPDLTPKWTAPLAGHLDDGCDTAPLPPNGEPGGCTKGAAKGVDPSTNARPAGIVNDASTASPVVTPDGGVLYGAYTRYNFARGHLFHFASDGGFRGTYSFGWDITPAIYEHDGTYSIVLKENNYDTGSYCADDDACPAREEGPHLMTQISPEMQVEWQFQLTNDKSCIRKADGSLDCVADHPNGFEWCINAPAVDRNGTVFANGEDGTLYAIPQGGGPAATFFLGEALGAAYTPLAVDERGRIYTQNVGRLFVLGE
jgi:outer membrane protein assembly factor BamB